MTVYASKIELWRAAFPLVGENPPATDSGTDDISVTANAIYEGVVRLALTKHGWSFAIKDEPLTYEAATGRKPAYRYAMPSDVLLPRFVELDSHIYKGGTIRGQKYFTDILVQGDTDLRLFYTWRALESQWPADFSDAVMHIFAGRLAKGPLEQVQKGVELEAMGKRELMNAKARDRSANGGIPRSRDDALINAWNGRTSVGVAPNSSASRYQRGNPIATGS